MSSVDLENLSGKVDVIPRTEGADTVLTQAVAVVDPSTGNVLPLATETTLAALKGVADALLLAINTLDTSAIAGIVSVSNLPSTQTVAGTVALDAPTLSALESINATTGGLTDTQLRASAVAVSGTVALDTASLTALENVNASVSGTVALDAPTLAALESIQATTSGLTNAELRASAVSVSTELNTIAKTEDTPHTSGDFGIPLLAIRSDGDTFTADEGDYTVLKLDEQGRLKVSIKPASYPDITGDITAIQAIINTPVAGGTVAGDVSRASNLMIFCTGTFAGINCTFEGSLEATGDTNWFAVQAVRTNANTIELTTGVLAAQPAYAWEASVNALKRFRVRCTARTSGTQSWRFVQGTYATEPIPAAQVSGTQPVSGSVTVSGTATTTPANPTNASIINSAATTNGTVIKATAGNIYNITASNSGASTAFVKLHNSATVTPGTTAVALIIPIPAGGVINVPFGALGTRFATGICMSITGGIADTDTTAVAAGQVKVATSFI